MARIMGSMQPLLLFFFATLSLVSAWSIGNEHDRHGCQAFSKNPLAGCDEERTLFVDPISSKANFKTVQSAVASLPNNTETYILLIGSGNYTEQVNITRRGPLYLLGQTLHPNTYSRNTVNIIWRAIAVPGLDNAFTSTLTIAPNLNASLTGSGPTGFSVPADTPFGCIDFRTYNLNLINDFAPYSVAPSLALSLSYSNGSFYYTTFSSYQDTLYIGKLGSAFLSHSLVSGQTDFLYGFGTLWIQSSTLHLRSCGGGITAWKGTNTTFPNKYGVYVVDSIVKAENETVAETIRGRCALGRPWNSGMRAVFARTWLDASVLGTGFIDWVPARYGNETVQAEYRNWGPGWNATARAGARFDVQLSEEGYRPYSSPEKVFQFQGTGRFGNTGWIDRGFR